MMFLGENASVEELPRNPILIANDGDSVRAVLHTLPRWNVSIRKPWIIERDRYMLVYVTN